MKAYTPIFASVLALLISCRSIEHDNRSAGADTLVSLKNNSATITFSRWGGALVDFHLNHDTVNPFNWRLNREDMPVNNQGGAPFQGHFLCTGRWGSPTPGEIQSGIPHNGEPSNVWWILKEKTGQSLVMSCEAKLEGFKVERTVTFSTDAPFVEVNEVFSNKLNIARNLPVVQHATIAAPFLDSDVVIKSNATDGFNQKFVPGPFLEMEMKWPLLKIDSLGKVFDIQKSIYTEGFVGTYIFYDSIGWVTAYNPKLKLLLGYAWKTRDYPWLHIWHGTKDGKLTAKGIEFGTTGLGDTSPLEERFLLNFHGRTNLSYVDANSSVKKRYVCFLIRSENESGGEKIMHESLEKYFH